LHQVLFAGEVFGTIVIIYIDGLFVYCFLNIAFFAAKKIFPQNEKQSMRSFECSVAKWRATNKRAIWNPGCTAEVAGL
jgi:hypothetical protein